MILGRCRHCDRLVPIVARGMQHDDYSRQRKWFPVDHEDAGGALCPGTKRPL